MSEEVDKLPFMLVSVIADDNDMTEDCVLLSLRPLMVLTTCRELGFEVTWLFYSSSQTFHFSRLNATQRFC